MTIIEEAGFVVIAALGVGTIAMFLAIVAVTVLVTIAVHVEEGLDTLGGPPPGRWTGLVRRLLAFPQRPARSATLLPRAMRGARPRQARAGSQSGARAAARARSRAAARARIRTPDRAGEGEAVREASFR